MNNKICSGNLLRALVAAVAFSSLSLGAYAQTFKVLYTFTNVSNGFFPTGTLALDGNGNLFGTTQAGGNTSCNNNFMPGCGLVFKVDSSGKETVLHKFTGSDGANPVAGPILDSAGNLYGTTSVGGPNSGGTVYKVTSSGAESVLYGFNSNDQANGVYPIGPVLRDSTGNLYGTTSGGGAGTVFKLDTSNKLTTLYVMAGAYDDGGLPYGALLRDSAGNLYGTDSSNGDNGGGTIFKVDPKGTETVIYAFKNINDGSQPWAGLLLKGGRAFGTTYGDQNHFGTVYSVTPAGVVTTIYSFKGGADGGRPAYGTLVTDSAGNLYGTASQGGGVNNNCPNSSCGVVFELSPNGSNWTYKVLHTFTGGADGGEPLGGLTIDASGNLYGTAAFGGGATGLGTVFEVTP
jgi:uncharacterized repeat protein (TIGR03803 family)